MEEHGAERRDDRRALMRGAGAGSGARAHTMRVLRSWRRSMGTHVERFRLSLLRLSHGFNACLAAHLLSPSSMRPVIPFFSDSPPPLLHTHKKWLGHTITHSVHPKWSYSPLINRREGVGCRLLTAHAQKHQPRTQDAQAQVLTHGTGPVHFECRARGAPARVRAWRCEGRPPLPHHFVCVVCGDVFSTALFTLL